jgi:hypothetical protein
MPRDYENATTMDLAAWRRQFRKSPGLKCEFGHAGCGCSTTKEMDGKAPCVARVIEEQNRRLGGRVLS